MFFGKGQSEPPASSSAPASASGGGGGGGAQPPSYSEIINETLPQTDSHRNSYNGHFQQRHQQQQQQNTSYYHATPTRPTQPPSMSFPNAVHPNPTASTNWSQQQYFASAPAPLPAHPPAMNSRATNGATSSQYNTYLYPDLVPPAVPSKTHDGSISTGTTSNPATPLESNERWGENGVKGGGKKQERHDVKRSKNRSRKGRKGSSSSSSSDISDSEGSRRNSGTTSDSEASRNDEIKRSMRKRKSMLHAYSHLAATANSRIPPATQKALAPFTLTAEKKGIEGSYAVELSDRTAYAQHGNGSNTNSSPSGSGGPTIVSPTASLIAHGKQDINVAFYFRSPPQACSSSSRNRPRQRPLQPPPTIPASPKKTSSFSWGGGGGNRGSNNSSSSNSSGGPPPLPFRSEEPGHNIPVEVLLKTAKGKLWLNIPERVYNRPMRVICSVEGPFASVSLPVGFDGKLAIWAPKGTIDLSETLRANSTIIPSTTSTQVTVYRIVPSPEIPTLSSIRPEDGGELLVALAPPAAHPQAGALPSSSRNPLRPTMMMDLCQINCQKGRVKVEYAKPPKGSGGGCTIM